MPHRTFEEKEHDRPPGASRDRAGLAEAARAAAAGDTAAWNALVESFTPALRGAARGFRLAPADVDDVVQATWLAAFTHIRQLRQPEAIAGWLLVTARREALRSLQRGVREVLTAEPRCPSQPDLSCQEAAVIDAECRAAVKAAVERLPERQRHLVGELFGPAGSSYAELSAKLGMPIGSIGPTRPRAAAPGPAGREHRTAVTPEAVAQNGG
jgi:RNA polymerase sigma factor (sigma-70 family)